MTEATSPFQHATYSGPSGKMHFLDLIVSIFAFSLLQILRLTWRIKIVNIEHRREAEKAHAHGAFAMAIWHENLFATIAVHSGQKFAPLASLSRDGDIVSWVMNHLGFTTIRGSSSRGGMEARAQLIDALNQGYFTALTVDGPRGPRREAKSGIVDISKRTGASILPVSVGSRHSFVFFKSWDKFRIPLPFARLTIHYGKPIFIASDLPRREIEDQRKKVDEALNRLEEDS